MSGIAPFRPDQENHSAMPKSKALEPLFAIGKPVVFHRNHREIERTLQFRQIDTVLGQIDCAFRFVPSDYG
jgi:hypothetical protein